MNFSLCSESLKPQTSRIVRSWLASLAFSFEGSLKKAGRSCLAPKRRLDCPANCILDLNVASAISALDPEIVRRNVIDVLSAGAGTQPLNDSRVGQWREPAVLPAR